MRITMRRMSGFCFALALGALLAGCYGESGPKTEGTDAAARSEPEGPPPKGKEAVATIEAKSGSQVTGNATFTEKDGVVNMELRIRNAPPGVHAVHIHEFGDCSDPEAKSAGSHWNPTGSPHGKWGHGGAHLGDIGNLEVDAAGEGTVTLSTNLWTIGDGAASDIVGKSLIIHADPDDFVTQPTGNAGGRIGCGVIRLK